VVAVGMPKIGIVLSIGIKETVEISDLFVAEELTQIDKTILDKELLLCIVHSASPQLAKGKVPA
jgi:hypothetical protein